MISKFNLTYIIGNMQNIELAYKIQKETWSEEPDYSGFYAKAKNPKKEDCFFLIYDRNQLIGIMGLYVEEEYPDSIWLDWFTILPQYRKKGYGEKVLLDTIAYCKNLKKYESFRVDTTYYKDRPALFLYDKVMQLREEYTIEDTEKHKNHFLIYTYSLKGKLEPWNNKYLGLREYYDKLKDEKVD